MSRLSISHTCHPSESAEMVDVDVTPVMNMFIILIPFLVSMAVFTQVSVLSFTLPPNVGNGMSGSGEKPKLKTTVVVAPAFLAITLGDRMLDSIPAVQSGHDFEALSRSLMKFRPQMDIQDEVIVAVRDELKFQSVVKAMDICKESGFSKIGISSATMNAEKGI